MPSNSEERERELAALRAAVVRSDWDLCVRLARSALEWITDVEATAEFQYGLALGLMWKAEQSCSELAEAAATLLSLVTHEKGPTYEKGPTHRWVVLQRALGSVFASLADCHGSDHDECLLKSAHHYETSVAQERDDSWRVDILSEAAYSLIRLGRASALDICRAQRLLRLVLSLSANVEGAGYEDHADRLVLALNKGLKCDALVELFAMATAGAIDGVVALLDTGIDIDVADHEGCTPLHIAIGEGHTELVTVLLERGANRFARDRELMTGLHWSIFPDDVELMMLVIGTEPDVDPVDATGRSPLNWAVSENAHSTTELLLSRGADPNLADMYGRTPLHFAVVANNVHGVRALHHAGALMLRASLDGETPLELARRLGIQDVQRTLEDLLARNPLQQS
jgi:hypothetical protein